MNSRIALASVSHHRSFSVENSFEYPFICLILDLDEISRLDQSLALFAVNRNSLLSLSEIDYLSATPENIKSKLFQHIKTSTGKQCDPGSRVYLVTAPRLLGRVFNPVSFYFVFNKQDKLDLAMAEVNNTFGDKHTYILDQQINPGHFPAKFKTDKNFHVSPFFDLKGEYLFNFEDIRERLDLSVTLMKNNRPALRARLAQSYPAKPLTDAGIMLACLSRPLSPRLTWPRILRQAMKLYFVHKLQIYTRPEPHSNHTIRTMHDIPSFKNRVAMNMVLRNLKKMKKGTLSLLLPDRSVLKFGGVHPGPEAVINVHDWDFFTRLARSEDVGLGESYTSGLWSSPDLTDTLEVLALNMNYMSYMENWGFLGRILRRSILMTRRIIPDNNVSGSRKNIRAHYDLSDELFSGFLDQGMNYSCGVFKDLRDCKHESLESAQIRKLEMAAEDLNLHPQDHVLDLGCGWGGFSLFAAQKYGCRVSAVTISDNQYKFLENKIKELGLGNKVSVILKDYRKLQGEFDKIVSIEMLEAIGHKHHKDYFKTIDRLLRSDGKAFIQTITIVDQRYQEYRRTRDWISTYIFPGGLLPSLHRITSVLTAKTTLSVKSVRDIGLHYAPTLAAWQKRFQENWPEIEKHGFDETFFRTWQYYLSICQAGFRTRHIRDLQLVLDRPAS
ncbi:DUF1365 family protein [Desulfonatronovibrio magnus]|uniref:DUF1365 family protein n=1 Tax=Desulfonatronovibrio magnus TaxID=698827 RepID=UPI0005EAFA80|nr:DUF1365 family protein [Desulfonatronovibrio magnus]